MNYPGGKGKIYQKLINLIPPHDVYIETHLGGGAIMRNKRLAKRNIGIDIHRRVIDMWKETNPSNVELIDMDAVSFLKSYSFTGKEFVYCDPPYLRNTRRKSSKLYKHEYTEYQHIALLEIIKSLPCMVMISGYESILYKEYLKNWYTRSFRACCHHGVATEWVWMNYPTPVELHEYSYLGNSFRERERIKRKTYRWKRKLESMPILEKQALLSAMHEAINKN